MKPEDVTPILNSFEVYLKSNRVKAQTLKTYMPVAKKFLETATEISENEFRTFQANSYGLKNNTALRNYWALKSLFASQNVAVNIAPPPQEDHPNRPTINKDDMKRLIFAIKAGGTSTERGILALSSIYGLRRVEMQTLTRADIDFNEETIIIKSAKRGRERKHLIPDCVFSFITGYDFKPRNDTDFMLLFHDITNKAGLNLSRGHGWHSIRRAVYTGFVENDFDYFLRHEFMRWSKRDLNLDQIYSRLAPGEIDKQAFAKHPFLKWWQ